ncbi:MAG: S1-like domain-containing RNA-binding protein [Fibromonadales bacterium]|nr:S1-like domain-containing RNA-binding protein [Fibromonadales bacterium]
MLLGNYNDCVVLEELPQGFYVETKDGKDRVLLPKSKTPKELKIGDEINLFIYLDNEARPIATTQKAKACVNEFAVLRVKDVNDAGAFLDWGLDKDLILPYNNQLGELQKNDTCVVWVFIDEKSGRLSSTEKLRRHFDRDVSELKEGMEVSLTAYDFQEDRCIDFVINKRWTGRLYCNPASTKLRIGDLCTGYIHSIKEDSLIALSLSPIGFDALVGKHKDALLKTLKENNGFLPFSDNSSPEEIQARFGMSKKGFKKLAGKLWKQGVVELSPEGIRLAKG